jgi:kynurenine formamidase
MKLLDLTHTLSSDIPHWHAESCFSLKIATNYDDCIAPNLFRTHTIEAKAGCGTHIDAPAHCFPDGKTIDQLKIENFVTDCVVIHAEKDMKANDMFLPESIEQFEEQNGKIPQNAFVIFASGWDTYWQTPQKYRNELQFPSVHPDTAEMLVSRNVAGIGIDTLSPDAGGKDFPTHRVILGAGKFIVENIANAKNLPATGAKIMVMPLKIKDGTEAPIRLVAWLP